jgi:hypothetical protein
LSGDEPRQLRSPGLGGSAFDERRISRQLGGVKVLFFRRKFSAQRLEPIFEP